MYLLIITLIFISNFCLAFSDENQRPKNIIILIGDGMGVNYVSASILSTPSSPFRKFSSIGLSITRAANKLVTDSAPGATAISTGYSVNYMSVAENQDKNPLKTILELAKELGLSTGLVVTSSLTDATPAAFAAHVSNRKYQTEIAKQFVYGDIDVAIGGGEEYLIDSLISLLGISGIGLLSQKGYDVYFGSDSLLSNQRSNKFYALLGKKELPRANERNYSLADLTKKALSVVSKNEKGFVLVVEGSQIDWGGHQNDREYIFSELNDFCKAVDAALDFASDSNTLVLVTADHETGGMSITGGSLDGLELEMKFTTTGHTAEMVGVFARGPGEELFRGVYENYFIGRNLFKLLNPQYKF